MSRSGVPGDPAPAPPGPAARKAELRAEVQAWRRRLPNADVRRWSRDLCAHLLDWAPLSPARVVLAFASLRREPQTAALIAALQGRGVRVALPRVAGPDLELAEAAAGAGVRQDAGSAVRREDVDAVLVPGLAFDRAGRRLGRGGGHYDRLLPSLRADCLRIGLCFEGQWREAVPQQAWDQAVDAVATEAGVWEMGSRATRA